MRKREEFLAARVAPDQAFAEYIEKYLKTYKKPSTHHSDTLEDKCYLKTMFIRDIEEKHIVDAYAEWTKATSFSTVNKILSLFSSMWDWSETFKYVLP